MLIYDNYPVTLDFATIKTNLDIEPDTELIRLSHLIVYDFLIYPTYNEDIKNRIIERYRTKLEKPLLKALLAQYEYLVQNRGNIGNWSGLLRLGQSIETIENQEILTKIVSPMVVNILKGAPIDLLYAGG